MTAAKLTLERGNWYALTMYPGYADEPYCSPIRVEAINPLGSGLVEIEYLNAGYAEGVQLLTRAYRVHRRGERHLVLDDIQAPDRTVIIEPLSEEWIGNRAPWFPNDQSSRAKPNDLATGQHTASTQPN